MAFRRFAGMAVIILLAMGAGAHGAPAAEPVGPKLPPKLRALLLQEMNAVLSASHDILDALVRGRDDVVAAKAQGIHDSFILDREMTEADRQALRAAVPVDFIERDRAFHALTGRLAEAARAGDAARQRALFGETVRACAACHQAYATNRFPAFGGE